MQLLKRTPKIDFIGQWRIAVALGGAMILISLASLIFQRLNFGIDFTGGQLIEVAYEGPAELENVRQILADQGYPGALVQNFGTVSDVLIRLPPVADLAAGESLAARLLDALKAADPSVQLMRMEFVGPQVGEDLTEQGGLAMLFALLMIFGYVMLRFRWKFAAGAIIGLVFDVIITIGFFSLLNLTFDLTILAAILTVIGYSLNDTIVVYDRIRENFRIMRRGTSAEIINASINQTLARTLMTGVTTLLVLIGLAILGGQSVSGFAIAVIIGIVIGTYSTVYVASLAALWLGVAPADMMEAKREELDELP
jgi:preprotein translocase subunit SecF